MRSVIARGGKVVVIDPRRTETAQLASEHHFIRPGTDAAFLLAVVHTLFEEQLVDLGAAAGLVGGLATVAELTKEFTPESVADYCGIPGPGDPVAKAHAGVNTNVLTDNQAYDEASGTTVLFGTPVTIEPLTPRR